MPQRIDSPDDPRLEPFRDIRERDLVGRQGRCILEGVRVLEIAATGTRLTLGSVLISTTKAAGLADLIAHLESEAVVFVVDQPVMDALVGFPIHRGVLAVAETPPDPGAAALLAGLPERACVVAAVGLANHDNVGAVFRNAAAFGADAVLLDESSADPFYRKAIRVSLGHALRLPFARGGDALTMLGALEVAGFDVLALSPRGAMTVSEVRPGPRTALLLGPEGPGLPDPVLKRCRTVSIPMADGVDSLNVATAAAVALSHLRR